jgi:hypothetical protein
VSSPADLTIGSCRTPTPPALLARYDHIAERWAFPCTIDARHWGGCQGLSRGTAYDITPDRAKAFEALGIDVEATRARRRRFAFACVDWSERRPHLGGALGAALLEIALRRKWVSRDLDSRILSITRAGQREMQTRFGLTIREVSLRADS